MGSAPRMERKGPVRAGAVESPLCQPGAPYICVSPPRLLGKFQACALQVPAGKPVRAEAGSVGGMGVGPGWLATLCQVTRQLSCPQAGQGPQGAVRSLVANMGVTPGVPSPRESDARRLLKGSGGSSSQLF